jgi:hypothetical protein
MCSCSSSLCVVRFTSSHRWTSSSALYIVCCNFSHMWVSSNTLCVVCCNSLCALSSSSALFSSQMNCFRCMTSKLGYSCDDFLIFPSIFYSELSPFSKSAPLWMLPRVTTHTSSSSLIFLSSCISTITMFQWPLFSSHLDNNSRKSFATWFSLWQYPHSVHGLVHNCDK